MDVSTLLFLIFIVPGILWYISISLLSKWKYFKQFFVVNGILVLAYSLYLIYGNLPFIGHDEYGLQRMGYIIIVPIIHVAIGFFTALVIRWKSKKVEFK